MLLELADNGQQYKPRRPSPRSIQLPCKCLNGKIAYVYMPTGNGSGVWMRSDRFNSMLSDSGYTVEHTELSGFWKDVGKFFTGAAKTVIGAVVGGQQSGGGTTVNIPGQQGGNDSLNMILGMILGNKAPGSILQPPPPQQQPQAPNYILPLAIGGGVLLLTLLISRK